MSKVQITETAYYEASYSNELNIVEKSSHTDVNEYTTFLYVYEGNKITGYFSRVIRGLGVFYYEEKF